MKLPLAVIVSCALLTCHTSTILAQKAGEEKSTAIETVQSDVRKNTEAVHSGDIETVLKYTHPKLVEVMGGKEAATKSLKQVLDQFKTLGLKVESLDFPTDPTFKRTAKFEYAVIPIKSVMSVGAQKVEGESFQLGVRPLDSEAWTYIDGAKLTKESARQLLPDLPADIEFPKVVRKKL